MKIKNFWANIHGWFDFQDIYLTALTHAKTGDKLVEIGSFVGKSTCFMLESIDNLNKGVEFYAVDLWDMDFMNKESGSPNTVMMPWNQTAQDWIDKGGADVMYDTFLKNVEESGYKEHLTKILRKDSSEAARNFPDKSLFFVFIDAGHSYESVKKDITAWFPKIKSGGIIAGHDFLSGESIRRAVKEMCDEHNLNLNVSNNSWLALVK